MLTVLVLASPDRAPALITEVESVAEARVVSHTQDSALALARAKVPPADVLVADLSTQYTPDSATGVHRARRLSTPCTVEAKARSSAPSQRKAPSPPHPAPPRARLPAS
ncbi:hypothetical protein [Streptomyces sp. NPDC055140]